MPDQISIMDKSSYDVLSQISGIERKIPDNYNYLGDLRIVDISNLLGADWIKLAPEIGITQEEIDEIIEENPTSTAQQAQSMLRLYQNRKADLDILENGLKRINRGDIIVRCMKITQYIKINKQGDARTRIPSLDNNGFEESDLMKDSESLEELVQQEGKLFFVNFFPSQTF